MQTKKLLKQINKLTNEIDKLLRSNTPKAKRMLKSLASKGRELGIIISDDLTDNEVGEVIKKAPKKTKQALIYAIQNEIPNLKTLHKGKKNFKLDKAYATKKKLNFAIGPDREPEPQSVREERKAKLKEAAKLKREMKKAAEEKLKNDSPSLYALLKQEERYRKEEKARWRQLKNLEAKKVSDRRKAHHKNKIEELRTKLKQENWERQQTFNQERIEAILELKKSWETFANNKASLKEAIEKYADYFDMQKQFIDYHYVYEAANKNLNEFAKKYNFDPNLFKGLLETGASEKQIIDTLSKHKFESAEDSIRFLEAIANADPWQQNFQTLFKELAKLEKANQQEDLLYILPRGKLTEIGVDFKSGITNQQLENLQNTLEIFKIIADSPTKLDNENFSKGVSIISLYAKLEILCVELMAKVMSVIQVTSTKIGGDSWDNKFWWFATYKSKAVLDDGHTWVDKGFVVDWKGVHTRVEKFLTEIKALVDKGGGLDFDMELYMWANDFNTLASRLYTHYEKYKNHVEEGDLGIEKTSRTPEGEIITERVFNTEGFKKTAWIGEQYQAMLIEAQSQLTGLKSYCQEAISIAKQEITRFAKNRYK